MFTWRYLPRHRAEVEVEVMASGYHPRHRSERAALVWMDEA